MGVGQVQYKFGEFLLISQDKQLLRGAKPVPLKPKAFQTLELLLENHGHLIEKDVFLKRVWGDSFVEEVVLAQNISQLRKALGNGEEFIETVPRVGYRFIAPVSVISEETPESSGPVIV